VASAQQNVCAMVGFSVAQSAIFVQRLPTRTVAASKATAQTQTLVAIARGQSRVQMKRRTTILILTIATLTCWGQTIEEKEKEERLQFVFDSNLPDNLYDFYNQEKIRTNYKINRDLNPFYLRGDFNGDKKIDYALAVIESTTNKKGFLIYHPTTKRYFLIGAGKAIQHGYGDN
jgi:hypothetical protein